MLRSENFSRRHQRHLVAIFDHDRGGLERHDRFPAADVALEQPVHRKRLFEVACDFRQHALLRRRRLERQNPLQRFADFFFAHAHRDPALPVILRAAQRQRDLVVEELLENQPQVRRAAERVEQLDVFVFRRKMNREQRLAPARKPVARANLLRQRIGDVAVEIQQHGIDDSPQHPRADRANRFVHRHDASHFGRIRGRAIAAQNLDLRIHHLDPPRPVRVDLRLAVHHEPLPFLKPPFEIRAVKKSRVQRARRVAHRHVKHGAAPAAEPHRASAAARHFGQNRLHLPGNNFGDLRESNPVLVAEWQIAEQVANGHNPALLERRRTMRPHAAQIFHRIAEIDRHHQAYSGTDNPVGALTRAFSNLYHRFAWGIVSRVGTKVSGEPTR